MVIYSVPLIFGSVQHWLDKFNGVLLPFYLLGLLATLVMSVMHYGYQANWLQYGPANPSPWGWWNCFTYYMGVWVLMMYTFDYARFGREEDSQYHARFNFGMPFYLVTFFLNGTAGIYLASNLPDSGALSETAVVVVILNLLGIAGLGFVWVTQTRINTANYYLATVNMQVFFHSLFNLKLPKLVWACVVGVVVYILMLADVFAWLLQALAYQGVFVVAWVGVALAGIARNVSPDHENVAIYPPGVGAWFISVAFGIALMHGSAAFAAFSAVATFVSASGLYMLFSQWVQVGESQKIV